MKSLESPDASVEVEWTFLIIIYTLSTTHTPYRMIANRSLWSVPDAGQRYLWNGFKVSAHFTGHQGVISGDGTQ